jgi:ADP-ribose pyrophosphatase YjhB (NUDIX family)
MIQIAGVLLRLPDGKIVVNRRGKTAPVSAGLLALYGGHIETGEQPLDAAARELSEETSLKYNAKDLKFLAEYKITTEGRLRKFHAFELEIGNEYFDVYEGDGSEVYTVEGALARQDITASLRKCLTILSEKNGA